MKKPGSYILENYTCTNHGQLESAKVHPITIEPKNIILKEASPISFYYGSTALQKSVKCFILLLVRPKPKHTVYH